MQVYVMAWQQNDNVIWYDNKITIMMWRQDMLLMMIWEYDNDMKWNNNDVQIKLSSWQEETQIFKKFVKSYGNQSVDKFFLLILAGKKKR